MKKQSLSDAVIEIIRDARRDRATVASNKRAFRALKTLGLKGDELRAAGEYLGLWDHTGDVYVPGSPTPDD